MTNEETIKILQDCRDRSFNHYTSKEHDKALDRAINAISTLEKIKNIINIWAYDSEPETSDAYCNILDLIEKLEGEEE